MFVTEASKIETGFYKVVLEKRFTKKRVRSVTDIKNRLVQRLSNRLAKAGPLKGKRVMLGFIFFIIITVIC